MIHSDLKEKYLFLDSKIDKKITQKKWNLDYISPEVI